MKKILSFAFLCLFLLNGCSAVTPYPGITRTSAPTASVIPSETPSPIPSAVLTLPRYPVKYFELGNGLILFESIALEDATDPAALYRDFIDPRREVIGTYQNHRYSNPLILNESIEINITEVDDEVFLLTVANGGIEVYSTEIVNVSGVPGYVDAWSFGEHWAVEIISPTSDEHVEPCNDHTSRLADVILDGQSLKEIKGYQEVFGFQTIKTNPFYIYNQNCTYGISYGGIEISLKEFGYEEVVYRNHWRGFDPDPVAFENAVMFWAKRNGKNYWVLISALSK